MTLRHRHEGTELSVHIFDGFCADKVPDREQVKIESKRKRTDAASKHSERNAACDAPRNKSGQQDHRIFQIQHHGSAVGCIGFVVVFHALTGHHNTDGLVAEYHTGQDRSTDHGRKAPGFECDSCEHMLHRVQHAGSPEIPAHPLEITSSDTICSMEQIPPPLRTGSSSFILGV